MPKLYFCNTIYSCEPPNDINPLLLELYKEKKMLVLCARDRQANRIKKLLETEDFKGRQVYPIGWWEFEENGLFTEKGDINYQVLTMVDCIVVLDKERVGEPFVPALKAILNFFQK